VQALASQIQDGGRSSSWKNEKKNRHISATVRPIATKFGIVKDVDPLDRAGR